MALRGRGPVNVKSESFLSFSSKANSKSNFMEEYQQILTCTLDTGNGIQAMFLDLFGLVAMQTFDDRRFNRTLINAYFFPTPLLFVASCFFFVASYFIIASYVFLALPFFILSSFFIASYIFVAPSFCVASYVIIASQFFAT